MGDFLLEVRSQEIPATQLKPLIRSVTVRLFEELTSRGVPFEAMSTVATLRRIGVSVRGLAEGEPEREKLSLGPAVAEAFDDDGQPTPAVETFAEQVGVEVEGLEARPTERGEVLARVDIEPGRSMAEALQSLVPRLLKESAAKLDKVGSDVWPRPITGILALLDGDVVPFDFGGGTSGRESVGHPIFSPDSFEVEDWPHYRRQLDERGVVAGLEARRVILEERVAARAAALGGESAGAIAQLGRWAASCEIPGVVDGDLPPEAMALPFELLRTVLAERQEAAAVTRGGDVLPFFVAVMDRPDGAGEAAREGRRRAIAGDVLDAVFDYERDRQVPLVERARRLEQLTFHHRLGTYAEKSERLRELVALACDDLGWHETTAHALEAASLAKADLTTSAVGSFPALHGVIGGVMARSEGYVEPVWQAIYDQTLPTPGGAELPRGRAGQVLAVADRLGTLVGLFGLDGDAVDPEGRTQRGDPRGLRPLAAGLLRLIIDGGMHLDLDLLAARAVLLYGEHLDFDAESILRRLQSFLDRRLDHVLGAAGFGADEIEAAKAAGTRDLPDLVRRLEGLRELRGTAELRQLVSTARRLARMVDEAPEGEIDPELLVGGAESELFDALADATPRVDAATAEGRYAEALRALARLLPALDRFFIEVLVMDEDDAKRVHRLALLQTARRLGGRVARLAALEPDAHVTTDLEAAALHASRIPPWLASRSSKTD
ncbi:MAG: glycine--tRNA ligase subunit beta [Acidobacteriota bacterium]